MMGIELTGTDEVLAGLYTGAYDERLSEIRDAVNERRSVLSADMKNSLRVGDRVVFNGNTRPEYLIGVEATVVGLLKKNVKVLVEGTGSRFDGEIRTNPNLIDKVPA